MTEGPTASPPRRRLSRGERFALVFITLFAAGVALLALLHALFETVTLFGEQSTQRAHALAGQSLRIAIWAIVTPFSVWGLLRGGRRAVIAAVAWIALFVATTPWAWPSKPITAIDTDKPLWLSAWVFLWILVASVAATGIYSAQRRGRASILAMAIVATLGIAGVGVVCETRLARRSDAEQPKVLLEGRVELAALRSDPLWTALPKGISRKDNEFTASRAPWGERLPTNKSVRLSGRPDSDLFKQVVQIAREQGWVFAGSDCFGSSWSATLEKNTSVGNADLLINRASYLHYVGLVATIEPPMAVVKTTECWTQ